MAVGAQTVPEARVRASPKASHDRGGDTRSESWRRTEWSSTGGTKSRVAVGWRLPGRARARLMATCYGPRLQVRRLLSLDQAWSRRKKVGGKVEYVGPIVECLSVQYRWSIISKLTQSLEVPLPLQRYAHCTHTNDMREFLGLLTPPHLSPSFRVCLGMLHQLCSTNSTVERLHLKLGVFKSTL